MRKVDEYAPIKTQDIADIMHVVCREHSLSSLAYKRLHYYVVTLERMLDEALQTVRESHPALSRQKRKIHCN